jgi:hypothetical protein
LKNPELLKIFFIIKGLHGKSFKVSKYSYGKVSFLLLDPLVRWNICEKDGFLMPHHKNILLTHVMGISHAMVYGYG